MMLVPSLPPLPVGGAEMQALRLGEALTQKGISVSFITPGKNRLAKGTKGDIGGMPVYRMHSWPNALFGWLSGLKKKRQKPVTRIEYDDSKEITGKISGKVGWPTIIYYNIFYLHSLVFLWPRRRSFDIIHAHTMEWSAIVAVRLGKVLRKPVLIKDSTMNGFESLSRFPSGHHLQKQVILGAHFVAMTMVIRDNLILQGIPESKISLIPNGIRIDDKVENIGPSEENKKTIPPVVLFVGNLYQQPAKGVDLLLKAWSVVMEQFPDALLQILGDGDLPAYRQYAQSLGIGHSVCFEGKRADTKKYYQKATVFVLPSRREGMSNSLLEAMANSLPCVATDISGSRDLIETGVSGILTPPGDIPALSAAICYLLSHPDKAARMGKMARATVMQKADIHVVASKYISLYNRLCSLSNQSY